MRATVRCACMRGASCAYVRPVRCVRTCAAPCAHARSVRGRVHCMRVCGTHVRPVQWHSMCAVCVLRVRAAFNSNRSSHRLRKCEPVQHPCGGNGLWCYITVMVLQAIRLVVTTGEGTLTPPPMCVRASGARFSRRTHYGVAADVISRTVPARNPNLLTRPCVCACGNGYDVIRLWCYTERSTLS
jgi:hypothetical protein